MNVDKKIIINAQQHNCAHCGTKGANFYDINFMVIDGEKNKKLGVLSFRCSCCKKISTHLIKNLCVQSSDFSCAGSSESSTSFLFFGGIHYITESVKNLNDNIIMSIPTPTFVIDSDIPAKLRDPLIEAGKCLKENALVGASACVRKAIYEFLLMEKATGDNYDEKIKSIKTKWKHLEEYLDVLTGIKGVVSNQLHENGFEAFRSAQIKNYVDILEEIFKEIYVIPQKRQARKKEIFDVYDTIKKEKTPDAK